MLTVGVDQAEVERRLVAGEVCCPGCEVGVLAGWGWARARRVRGLDGPAWWLRPRRCRCGACEATHVLLPVDVLLRRADAVEVVGAALAAKASGQGARAIAARLGRAWETARGWLRRFCGRAEAVRGWFVRLLCAVAVDPRVPAPVGSPAGDAAAAVAAAAGAVAGRFQVVAVTVWQVACAASGGRLLAPGWPAGSVNTSWPWPVRS